MEELNKETVSVLKEGGKFVMIDLETLSLKNNAAIVSIGAVEFDYNGLTGREFLQNVYPNSCKHYGLDISEETVKWWKTQPREKIEAWRKNSTDLHDALIKFSTWFPKDSIALGYGSVFDLAILNSAYSATNIEPPWKFWDALCARTLFRFAGVNVTSERKKVQIETHHLALEDAKFQAELFIKTFT